MLEKLGRKVPWCVRPEPTACDQTNLECTTTSTAITHLWNPTPTKNGRAMCATSFRCAIPESRIRWSSSWYSNRSSAMETFAACKHIATGVARSDTVHLQSLPLKGSSVTRVLRLNREGERVALMWRLTQKDPLEPPKPPAGPLAAGGSCSRQLYGPPGGPRADEDGHWPPGPPVHSGE